MYFSNKTHHYLWFYKEFESDFPKLIDDPEIEDSKNNIYAWKSSFTQKIHECPTN